MSVFLSFLLALIPLLIKLLPEKKSVQEKAREKMIDNRKHEEKFRNEKDTSDLGNLP